jgi:hypothetical protein
MTTYNIPQINERPPQLVDLGYYADIRFDADDALPDYIGLNLVNGQATSEGDWKIYKFTYSGSSATRIQLAYGAWDDRVSLF